MTLKDYKEFEYFLGILLCESNHTYNIIENENYLFEIWNMMRYENSYDEIIAYILDDEK